MTMCGSECHGTYVEWKSEESFWGLVFSFDHTMSGDH